MAIDYSKRPSKPEPPTPPASGGPASSGPVSYSKAPPAAPAPPPAAPVSLSKITLTKSAPSISLTKHGTTSGQLRVNLRWTARSGSQSKGFFKAKEKPIDLDLGCLWEFSDGTKGVVQALGNAMQAPTRGTPIVRLDADDRSGSSAGGENLFVDLSQSQHIKRVLVFAYIYEGAPNWASADATVTLYPMSGPEVELRLDEADSGARFCAIALLENRGGELTVNREVRYIRGSQRDLDQAYGWGMQWQAGSK